MSGMSITLHDYLKNAYKWKESFFYEGASTLCVHYRTFKAAIQPNRNSKLGFFRRWLNKMPLEKLLSEIQFIKISEDLLRQKNDLSDLTPEKLALLSEQERNQIELLRKLMEASGQEYQTQLEFFTEPFRSAEAAMNSILGKGVLLSESLNDFPFGEPLKLTSFDCSMTASPTPYICLQDNKERKWYFDMQLIMHTNELFIDGEIVASKIARSFKSLSYR